jgi:hypothetical protein
MIADCDCRGKVGCHIRLCKTEFSLVLGESRVRRDYGKGTTSVVPQIFQNQSALRRGKVNVDNLEALHHGNKPSSSTMSASVSATAA